MENIKKALISAIENGEWELFYRWLSKVVKMKSKGKYDIDYQDVVHDVWLKMERGGHFKKLYDQDASPGEIIRYIQKTATSVMMDKIRETEKESRTRKKFQKRLEISGGCGDDSLSIEEMKAHIKNILDRWKNPTHRKIICLLLEGIKRKEIAKQENVSEALISILVKRLRKELNRGD